MAVFDLASAYQVVNESVSSGKPTSEVMTTLLAYCADVAPGPVWQQISMLDYEHDLNVLRDWLQNTLISSPPEDDIIAYFFGFFTAMVNDGQHIFQLYLAGTDEFDLEDESGDWACDPAYFPDSRYAPSELLAQLYQLLVVDDDAFAVGEYVLCLGYAAVTVRDLMQTIDCSLLLGSADTRAVAVGFDEGDILFIGQITRNGFQPAEAI